MYLAEVSENGCDKDKSDIDFENDSANELATTLTKEDMVDLVKLSEINLNFLRNQYVCLQF